MATSACLHVCVVACSSVQHVAVVGVMRACRTRKLWYVLCRWFAQYADIWKQWMAEAFACVALAITQVPLFVLQEGQCISCKHTMPKTAAECVSVLHEYLFMRIV